MKKIVIVLTTLFFASCVDKSEIKKPEKLIEKEQMENILYDLAVLQAVKNYFPQKLTENGINSKTYVYQKYKIDSLQLVENNRYYASHIEEYKKIFTHISERIKNQKTIIDTLAAREQKRLIKKVRDSIIKSAEKNKQVTL
jgi:ABC-type multidrug transport system fused ATPase/permease subunit